MARASVSKSKYDSPLRARQAAETRRVVLQAAGRLFSNRGWAATTLAAVAAEAGTAIETIYSGFGSKAALLSGAIDVALVGDDDPVALAERPEFLQMENGGRRQRVAVAAQLISDIHARSVPLLRALQEAAASDPIAAERWERYEADRREAISLGAALVTGSDVDEATIDGIWALSGPEIFAKLVLDRGWTPERYRHWLAEAATPLLPTRKDVRR